MKLIVAELIMSHHYGQRLQMQIAMLNRLQALTKAGVERSARFRLPYSVEYTFIVPNGRPGKKFTKRLVQLANLLQEDNVPYYLDLLVDIYDDGNKGVDRFGVTHEPGQELVVLWSDRKDDAPSVLAYLQDVGLIGRGKQSYIIASSEQIKSKFLERIDALGEERSRAATINTLLGG